MPSNAEERGEILQQTKQCISCISPRIFVEMNRFQRSILCLPVLKCSSQARQPRTAIHNHSGHNRTAMSLPWNSVYEVSVDRVGEGKHVTVLLREVEPGK